MKRATRGFVTAGLLAALGIGSCARSDTGGGVDMGPPIVPGADALPVGAISFFNGKSCPKGWAPFAGGEGRLLIAAVGDAAPGSTSGAPLDDSEDRTHGHALSASIETESISFVGIAGTGNDGVAGSGTVKIALDAVEASSALPYLQLLVCSKVAAPERPRDGFPSGMLTYFDRPGCPDGWRRSAATEGRLIVALPPKGKPGALFGGPPLRPLPAQLAGDAGTPDGAVGDGGSDGGSEFPSPPDAAAAGLVDGGSEGPGTTPRLHSHVASSVVQTQPYGLAVFGGCCASGFAKNEIYSFTTVTSDTEVGLPYIELTQCEAR